MHWFYQLSVRPEQYEIEPKIIKVRSKKAKAMTYQKMGSETYRAERAIHTTACLEYGRKRSPYCRQPLTWAERDAVTGDTPPDTLQVTKGAAV